MSNDKMRAEFEAAITKDRMDAGYDEPNLRMHEWEGSQCYNETHVQAAWWGWQAARAALEIEMPPQLDADDVADEFFGPVDLADAVNDAINGCRDAIEAAGVRVKS